MHTFHIHAQRGGEQEQLAAIECTTGHLPHAMNAMVARYGNGTYVAVDAESDEPVLRVSSEWLDEVATLDEAFAR